MTIMDENKTAEQRRSDLLERLRMRFYQYQKQHNDSSERYASNELVKEEKERQEDHVYQQRILSARPGSNKAVPKPRLDLNSSRAALNEAGLNNNLGGDQAMILQTLKRRFTESVNQSLSTAHSQQSSDDVVNPSKKPPVARALSIDSSEESVHHMMNNSDAGKSTSATPLAAAAASASTSVGDLPARPASSSGNSSYSSTTNGKPGNALPRTTADSLANVNHGNASSTESNGRTGQVIASGQSQAANATAERRITSDVNGAAQQQQTQNNFMSHNSGGDETTLKSEFHQISGDNLPFNIERDLADFEDVFRNISESNEGVVDTNHGGGGEEPKINLKTTKAARDKSSSSSKGMNGLHKHASGGGQGGMPHLSHFESNNTFTTSQPLMSSHFSAATNQAMNKVQQQQQQASQQQQQQMPPRSLVGVGYPTLTAPNAASGFGGRASTRPNLVSHANTKNPEIVEKLQQHLIQQQIRRKQQQAVASPAGMQAAMQHHQYRQSMMNYMQQQQQSGNPRMPPMSPSMPQNFRQHPVASPVDQAQQNPFHFQPDYNMYMEQQKMMQSPDAMPMQSPTMNGPRMPPGYYPQDPGYGMMQSPMYATSPQQRPTGPSMFPPASPMHQHMVSPSTPMNMMGGQGYQPSLYQQNANVPQRLPPQYNDASFHFNPLSLDNQPAMQVQMSSSRLSHFMTPPDQDGAASLHGERVLKSPTHMVPPYSVSAVSMQQQQQQQLQQRNKMYNGTMKSVELNDTLPKYPQAGDYRTMHAQGGNMMRFNGQLPPDATARGPMMGQYFSQDQMVPQTALLETQMARMQSAKATVAVDTKPKQELFSPMSQMDEDLPGSLAMSQSEPEDIETLLSNPPQDFDLAKMLGHKF